MNYKILGKDLKVSAVGLGCMGFSHAYGAPTEINEAIRTIRSAYAMGYNFFDTAECYVGTCADGTLSFNEELVGRALKDVRGDVVIATKFGVKHEGRHLLTDSRPEVIRRSVEGSLKRLKTDHIDLYYQHRIDPNVSAEEVASVMADLIKEGKITHWGISEANEEYLRRANAVCPVTAIQNRYSMMYRSYERLFPVLEELKVGFVAFSPLANGVLSAAYNSYSKFEDKGDYRADMPQFQPQAYEQNTDLFAMLKSLAERYSATPAQISLAWMMNKKPYIVPIPGSSKETRIRENGGAAEIKLTKEEVALIDDALDRVKMSEVFGGHK